MGKSQQAQEHMSAPLTVGFSGEGIVHSSGLFWSCHGNKSLLYLKFKVTPSIVLYVESGSGSPKSSGWWPRTAQRSPPYTSSQRRAPKALAPDWLDQSDLQQSASIGLYIKTNVCPTQWALSIKDQIEILRFSRPCGCYNFPTVYCNYLFWCGSSDG